MPSTIMNIVDLLGDYKHVVEMNPDISIFYIMYQVKTITECTPCRNVLYRDKKCGRNCLSRAAQLPVLNGRKRSPTFHESSNISFNISYLGYY